jgi:NADPH:quinone reductase
VNTGKRVIVREYGEDPLDALDKYLAIEEQAPPDPASLRSTDVIVRVESAAIGWVDLLMTSGQYQHLPPPPYTPGLEYAGTIVWAGKDVGELREGDRVVADGLHTGPRSQGDYQRWGGFASYAVAPSIGVRKIFAGFDFDEAASFFASYETAYHCLVARARLCAGETILIHGASGSSGLAAVQIAKKIGATVIATGRSPEKLAIVKAQGADHTITSSGFKDEVKSITGGRGADVVYDAVGGEVSLESLRCVAFGARFLIVGWASTPFVAKGKGQRGAPNANVLPTNLILMKGLDVLGAPTAIATHRDPSIRSERLERLVSWAEQGALRPLVSQSFPIAEAKAAMISKWESRHVGGTVLHPQER